MNLLKIIHHLAESSEWNIVFKEDACIYSLDKFSNCEACFDICPSGAIEPGKPPLFDEISCRYCRACLSICPTGAFGCTGSDSVQELMNFIDLMEIGTLELLCELNSRVETGLPEAEAAIRVRGCLAGLGPGGYLALLSKGVEKVIVRTDACATCPWHTLRPLVEAQFSQAQRWAELWKLSTALTCACPDPKETLEERPIWNADAPPRSRRQLIPLPDGEKEGKSDLGKIGGQHQFRERLRLLKAASALTSQYSDMDLSATLEGLGFALVSVADVCTACGTCDRACPTGALQIETTQSSFQLNFAPELCIGCEICQHVCRPEAISLDHAPAYGQIFGTETGYILIQGGLTRCERCHVSFADNTGSRLCHICEFRSQQPFGTMIPPVATLKRRQ